MPINYLFRSLEDEKELNDVVLFLRVHNWKYKNFNDWLERTRVQILSDDKKLIHVHYDGKIVADGIYQSHRKFPRLREIKNIRVSGEHNQRGIASFLVKLILTENTKDFDAVICDIPEENRAIQSVVKSIGFEELGKAPIYDDGRNHIIMIKKYEKTPAGIFAPIKNKLCA